MRRALSITCLLLIVACGDKETSSTAAAANSTGSTGFGDQVPADDTSQAFAQSLVSTNFTNIEPVELLNWDSLVFNADGTWSARGEVTMMDEEMACIEGGAWSMEAAERSDNATVTWHLDETNCAGRESGSSQRVLMTLTRDGTYDMQFR